MWNREHGVSKRRHDTDGTTQRGDRHVETRPFSRCDKTVTRGFIAVGTSRGGFIEAGILADFGFNFAVHFVRLGKCRYRARPGFCSSSHILVDQVACARDPVAEVEFPANVSYGVLELVGSERFAVDDR